MEFAGLAVVKKVGDEFHFSGFVIFAAFRGLQDLQKAPLIVVDAGVELLFEVPFPGAGMGGADQIVDPSEKEGTVAGAHELFRGFGLRASVVERQTAVGIALFAFAGTKRDFTNAGNAFFFLGFFLGAGLSGHLTPLSFAALHLQSEARRKILGQETGVLTTESTKITKYI